MAIPNPPRRQTEQAPQESSSGCDEGQAASQQPDIEWHVHPLRERPLSAICLIAFLSLLHIGVYFLLGHVVYVLISAAILFPSLSQFFLPVRYALQTEGITVSTPLRSQSRAWSEFRRCDIGRKGAFLSPFAVPTRLENYRGLYLRFGQHRDSVAEELRAMQEERLSC